MRVLIVDDHKLFTDSLKMALDRLQAGNQLYEAQSREEALDYARAGACFDMILLDLHMPGNDGMDNLLALREAFDTACIVVVSGETDPRIILQTIEHGAAGYVSKASDVQSLLDALDTVLRGGVCLPGKLLRAPFQRTAAPAVRPPAPDAAPPGAPSSDALRTLSVRQREALFSAIRGQSNKVIAREMQVAESTVKHHLAIAFKVLGVGNRTAAVYEANRLKLFPDTSGLSCDTPAPVENRNAC
ncbi:response regulator transcription factor [Massilia sp. S19_KUP03_FR1]|uniref:response regulator transcription factor n=1 Tax=Massilia sp. S19_KUP03_FR1 TaxID=3025503 RepID=UPI002FCDCCDD